MPQNRPKQELDASVEPSRATSLTRHGQGNVLSRIYDALPEERRAAFLRYREAWMEAEQREQAPPFPLNLYIEPVSQCNLRCTFCVRSRDQWRERGGPIFSNEKMGFERFRRIIDEGVEYGLPAIWFGASGEALLEKDTCQMIEYAHRCGVVDTILITNGQLLTKERVDELFRIPLTRLTVSIDAFSAKTYRDLRGGDYERLMRNLAYVVERRRQTGQVLPILRVSFIDLPANRHEKEAFIEYWSERADMIDIQQYWDFDCNDAPDPTQKRTIACAHPWRSLFITASGDVFPCCSFYAIREHHLGNIDTNSIADIWQSDKLTALRASLTHGSYREACMLCHDSTTKATAHG